MSRLKTASKVKRIVLGTTKGQVYIYFGADPKGGVPFEAAANYLHKRLKRIYKNSKVVVNTPQELKGSGNLMEFLLKSRTKEEDKIRELHIICHAWPTGLSLNYHGIPTQAEKTALEKIYSKNVWQNIGPDDFDQFNPIQFRMSNLQYLDDSKIKQLQKSFTPKAIARFWGCNTGYKAAGTTNPYCNISSAFAQYANITVYGSPKGTNLYGYIKGKWTTKVGTVGKRTSFPYELRAYRYPKSKQSNKFTPTVSFANLIKKKFQLKVEYFNSSLNQIQASSSNPELFNLKPGTDIHFALVNFEEAEKKIEIYSKSGNLQIIDKLMKLDSHPNWSLSADKKMIKLTKIQKGFSAKIHSKAQLQNAGTFFGEYYLVLKYIGTGGSIVFSAKKQRFAFL